MIRYSTWMLKLICAGILLQTLYFKFSGAPESVYIFTKIGIEPWGRIASGIAELIAAVLLLIPSVSWAGALLSLGVISGALMSHLIVLGIEVQGDGGLLFALALLVFLLSAVILFIEKKRIIRMRRSISGGAVQ